MSEVKNLWEHNKVHLIPVIVGTIGTLHGSLEGWLEQRGTKEDPNTLDKPCLLVATITMRYACDEHLTSRESTWRTTIQNETGYTNYKAVKKKNNNF